MTNNSVEPMNAAIKSFGLVFSAMLLTLVIPSMTVETGELLMSISGWAALVVFLVSHSWWEKKRVALNLLLFVSTIGVGLYGRWSFTDYTNIGHTRIFLVALLVGTFLVMGVMFLEKHVAVGRGEAISIRNEVTPLLAFLVLSHISAYIMHLGNEENYYFDSLAADICFILLGRVFICLPSVLTTGSSGLDEVDERIHLVVGYGFIYIGIAMLVRWFGWFVQFIA